MDIQDALGYKLGLSSRLMKRKMDQQLAPYGLTTSQWAVIALLDEKGELSQKQIADELVGDKVTAGEIVRKLVNSGYVKIEADPKDRRAHLVQLTSKAVKVTEDTKGIAEAICSSILSELTPNEVKALDKVFHVIRKKMED